MVKMIYKYVFLLYQLTIDFIASRRRLWEIQRLLNVARTVLPEIPYPQTLDVVTNNPLLHMQINMNYVDMAWKCMQTK